MSPQHDKLHKILIQYIEEGRSKPALISAKFCLLAQLDPGLHQALYNYASDSLEILSEIDDPQISFMNLYTVLTSTNQNKVKNNPRVKLSLLMYKLRTGMITDDELEDLVLAPDVEDGVCTAKQLLCKGLASLYCEHYGNAVRYIADAFDNDISVTRAILSAFSQQMLNLFRSDFVEAREKSLIPCSCNNTGKQSHGFRESYVYTVNMPVMVDDELIETSFINNNYANDNDTLKEQKQQNSNTANVVSNGDTLSEQHNTPSNSANGDTLNTKQNSSSSFQLCTVHRLITEWDDIIRLVSNRDRNGILGLHLKSGRSKFSEKYFEVNGEGIDKSDDEDHDEDHDNDDQNDGDDEMDNEIEQDNEEYNIDDYTPSQCHRAIVSV